MRAKMFDSSGVQTAEVELPAVFNQTIREDITLKCFEAEKFDLRQPYSSYDEAGKRHSASGNIKHIRHKWRTAYGKGISRIPRKTMWRRGNQFLWVGAEVSGTKGGRRSHPPKGMARPRKINQKEWKISVASGFAATASKAWVLKRYSSLKSVENMPYIIESVPAKTKDVLALLEKLVGKAFLVAKKEKTIRPGKGKTRGRRYKSSAGLLMVIGSKEVVKCKNIEVKSVPELAIADLYPLGRLAVYTKMALEEIAHAA